VTKTTSFFKSFTLGIGLRTLKRKTNTNIKKRWLESSRFKELLKLLINW